MERNQHDMKGMSLPEFRMDPPKQKQKEESILGAKRIVIIITVILTIIIIIISCLLIIIIIIIIIYCFFKMGFRAAAGAPPLIFWLPGLATKEALEKGISAFRLA